jgi:glucose/arabinose dehydrogenase
MTTTAAAALATARVKLTKIAGINAPTAFAARPGSDVLYVTEQTGRVDTIRGGKAATLIDLSGSVLAGGEQGLLGLAFSPDGSKLYIDYTCKNTNDCVDELTMQGDSVNVKSRRALLRVKDPQPNHNGGQLAFGPDGMLYIALGDGGAAGDQGPGHDVGGNAQSLGEVLGKILRINPAASATAPYTIPRDNPFVGRDGARGEIWSYGLRNPWRFTFDRSTGDLWIGDVGQNKWEEVDFAKSVGASAGKPGTNAGRGLNFGWNRFEGTHPYTGDPPSNAVGPIFEYSHNDGGCAVTGGYVYRGAAIPALRGAYLWADDCIGQVHAFVQQANKAAGERALGVKADQLSSFGQDNAGELYVLSLAGAVYKVEAA